MDAAWHDGDNDAEEAIEFDQLCDQCELLVNDEKPRDDDRLLSKPRCLLDGPDHALRNMMTLTLVIEGVWIVA